MIAGLPASSLLCNHLTVVILLVLVVVSYTARNKTFNLFHPREACSNQEHAGTMRHASKPNLERYLHNLGEILTWD